MGARVVARLRMAMIHQLGCGRQGWMSQCPV